MRIPLYNHSLFITRALDSIKEDIYPNKEIVIIDDGSNDNSVEIVEDWISKNLDIKVNFRSRKNVSITKTTLTRYNPMDYTCSHANHS